jgi:hypothetical protein
LKIEELEARIRNLINNMSELKDWALTMEKTVITNYDSTGINSAYLSAFSNEGNKSGWNNSIKLQADTQQRQLIETLRGVILTNNYLINLLIVVDK